MIRILGRAFVRGLFKAVGLDSPYSAKGYGPNWSKQRKKALERDNYACQICGSDSDEHSQELSVHHIRPRRQFDGNWEQNRLENLITVCPRCHGKVEGKWMDSDSDEFAERARKEIY